MKDVIDILSNSNLTFFLGPRPGKKSFSRLFELDLSHCCTLLSEREGAQQISKFCGKLGKQGKPCDWVWLPIEGGNLETLQQTDIASLVTQFARAIENSTNARIYFHCSAGIHRTGFFVYILLRLQGLERAEAFEELARLRQVTADQVGQERLDLADHIVEDLFELSD